MLVVGSGDVLFVQLDLCCASPSAPTLHLRGRAQSWRKERRSAEKYPRLARLTFAPSSLRGGQVGLRAPVCFPLFYLAIVLQMIVIAFSRPLAKDFPDILPTSTCPLRSLILSLPKSTIFLFSCVCDTSSVERKRTSSLRMWHRLSLCSV